MKWKWPVAATMICVIIAGSIYSWRQKHPARLPYREVNVERGDIGSSILSTGTVQPENRLEIKPPIAGRVETVLVVEGQHVKKGQLLAWISSTERAALLDAARAEGEAEVARWEQLYKPTPVVAPINGMIIARNVESGQTFASTDAVLVMSDRLTVKAQVDETDISQIKLKQHAEITLDAYPDARIEAQVDQIAFDAKTVNNVTTYTVDVLPTKAPLFMRSGMTANVSFTGDVRHDVMLIPTEALKNENGATTVLVRDPAGQPSARPLQTGRSEGPRTEISGGLNDDDVILVAPYALKDKKAAGTNPFMPKGPGKGNRPPGH